MDVNDLQDLFQAYGKGTGAADLNNDRYVNDADIAILEAQYGATCSDRLFGDVDGSGVVTEQDLKLVLGAQGSSDAATDIDRSGLVDETDVNLLMANYGNAIGQRILGDVDGDAIVTMDDVLLTLAEIAPPAPSLM